MLIKCETKSNRVKGLSFHPKACWILVALHNGVIQLWDYRVGCLIAKFEEHDGPVRGICFHRNLPLFVSGGDDYRIKLWNVKQRKCLFTLLGHLDYIRTVEFHNEHPWILSSSDDQTIRIWNWQSRMCIAVLTGHNHYVMCAKFHPSEDLVVSASLDQTVRVWDVSSLGEKNRAGANSVNINTIKIGNTTFNTSGTGIPADVLGSTDAVVKYVLEGHDRGVNWVDFHPTLPLIVSGADDRLVKLWRYNESKAWEVDSFRGHFNNVSSVIFHQKNDMVISNSEDRTIRVWDTNKRCCVHTLKRETDRFWIITSHVNSNLLAAGHDSGMVVFKLQRERPPCAVLNGHYFFVKDKSIYYGQANGRISCVGHVRKSHSGVGLGFKFLQVNPYNSTEVNLITQYEDSFDIYSKSLLSLKNLSSSDGSSLTSKSCSGLKSTVFTNRNRTVSIASPSVLIVANLGGEIMKRIDLTSLNILAEDLYQGGANRVLIKTADESKIVLLDLNSKRIISELSLPSSVIKFICFNQKQTRFAIVLKHSIILTNKDLKLIVCHYENNTKIKSGVFDEQTDAVFIYSTLTHIKYLLSNGDSSILKSVKCSNDDDNLIVSSTEVYYICRVSHATISYLTKSGDLLIEPFETSEYIFKLALLNKDIDSVYRLIGSVRLSGSVLTRYLQENGYPELALKYVTDPRSRFYLATDYGHLEIALQAALELNDLDVWKRLGEEALKQGNLPLLELVHQKTKSFDSLSFLYFLSGDEDRLGKMNKIAAGRKDTTSLFNNYLFESAVSTEFESTAFVDLFSSVGETPLAYLAAKSYGCSEEETKLKPLIEKDFEQYDDSIFNNNDNNKQPLSIINSCFESWKFEKPVEDIFSSWDERMKASSFSSQNKYLLDDDILIKEDEKEEVEENDEIAQGWGDDNVLDDGWGKIDDADLSFGEEEFVVNDEKKNNLDKPNLIQLSNIKTVDEMFPILTRKLPIDYVSRGQVDLGLNLLSKRIGLNNVDSVLRNLIKFIYAQSHDEIPVFPYIPSVEVFNKRIDVFTIKSLQRFISDGQRLMSSARFNEALEVFRLCLSIGVFIVVDSSSEEEELLNLILVIKDYIYAVRIELEKSSDNTSTSRDLELTAYMCCLSKLSSSHKLICLKLAMSAFFKKENYRTAAIFARQILSNDFGSAKTAAVSDTARKCLQQCEQIGTDAIENIQFKEAYLSSIKLSADTFTPIVDSSECGYCHSVFQKGSEPKTCSTCNMCGVGVSIMGIQPRDI